RLRWKFSGRLSVVATAFVPDLIRACWMLGLQLDMPLSELQAVRDYRDMRQDLGVYREAPWRLKELLQTGHFYTTQDTVRFCKCHAHSFIEGAIGAIFDAADAALKMIDDIQVGFLDQVSLTGEAELCEFNLVGSSEYE
ncbi:unnamed protein product, partial [Prorocentrum cordatum]